MSNNQFIYICEVGILSKRLLLLLSKAIFSFPSVSFTFFVNLYNKFKNINQNVNECYFFKILLQTIKMQEIRKVKIMLSLIINLEKVNNNLFI